MRTDGEITGNEAGQTTPRRLDYAALKGDGLSAVPRWFELVATLPAVAFATFGGTVLVLAMAGAYSLGAAAALGIPLTLAGWAVAVRAVGPARSVARVEHIAAAAALVIALAGLAFTGLHVGQHVTIDRDPGSYSTTARWIARDGSLTVDAAAPFDGLSGLTYQSAAVYDMGGGQLEFQFNHAASAAMALAFDVGGQRLLFRLPAMAAAAALLPVYAVARAMAGRAWLALAVTGGLAACLPFWFFGRGPYSEPFTMLVLWAGILALIAALARQTIAGAAMAGGLIGATVMTRVDGTAYLIPVVVAAGWMWVGNRRRQGAVLLVAAALPALVGAADGRWFTGAYYADLSWSRRQLTALLLVASVVTVIAALLRARLRPVTDWFRRPRVAMVLGAATVVVLAAAWFVRPLVMTDRGTANPLVGLRQAAQGLAVDPTRQYSEESLRWISWYVGPLALALAIVGAGVLVHWALVRRQPAETVLLLFLAFAGAIYLWDPSITPEQMWAMRRFVPLVLPACFVLAGGTIAWASMALQRRRQLRAPLRWACIIGASAVLVIPPAMATAPIRNAAEQAGFLDAVEAVCRQVPEGGGIVVAGPVAANTLPQTLRSWCGVPVASLTSTATPADLAAAANAWADDCKVLVLVTQNESGAEPFLSGGVPISAVATVTNTRLLERVVEEPPERYSSEQLSLTATPVPASRVCPAAPVTGG